MRGDFESGGCLVHGDTMAHPSGLQGWRTVENARGIVHHRLRLAVLAERRLVDVAAELMGHHLEAIADAKHRHSGREDALVNGGSTGFVHRRRAA